MSKVTKKYVYTIETMPFELNNNMLQKKYADHLLKIKEANSEYLLLDYTGGRLIYGILGGVFLFLFIYGRPFEGSKAELVLFILLLFITLWGFIDPPTDFKFNRKNGTVTYRNFLGLKKNKPFDSVLLAFGTAGPGGHGKQLRLYPKQGVAFKSICEFDDRRGGEILFAHQLNALIIWFMDKNRPLPPGEVFDQYRKKDHLRRHRDGFPTPLFDSEIPTPDHDNLVTVKDFNSEEEYLQYQKAYKQAEQIYERI